MSVCVCLCVTVRSINWLNGWLNAFTKITFLLLLWLWLALVMLVVVFVGILFLCSTSIQPLGQALTHSRRDMFFIACECHTTIWGTATIRSQPQQHAWLWMEDICFSCCCCYSHSYHVCWLQNRSIAHWLCNDVKQNREEEEEAQLHSSQSDNKMISLAHTHACTHTAMRTNHPGYRTHFGLCLQRALPPKTTTTAPINSRATERVRCVGFSKWGIN